MCGLEGLVKYRTPICVNVFIGFDRSLLFRSPRRTKCLWVLQYEINPSSTPKNGGTKKTKMEK